MPSPHVDAFSILVDPTRPSTILSQYTPAVPKVLVDRPREFAFFDDIRAFHEGDRGISGRFQLDYDARCELLHRVVLKLDEKMADSDVLPAVPGQLDEWRLHVHPVTWCGFKYRDHPETLHRTWYYLHHLRKDLDRMRLPRIQRTTLSSLPKSVHKLIAALLPMDDVRRFMATDFRQYEVCRPYADKHGKVTISSSHDPIELVDLKRICKKLEAEATPFAYSLAEVWRWMIDREHSGRLKLTLTWEIVNRCSWAATVQSEAAWNDLTAELDTWGTVFYCGVLALSALRVLRLDHFALPRIGLKTIAQHAALRCLHLHGCGLMLQHCAQNVPLLPRVRHLIIGWDPLSPFEVAAAECVLRVVPNVAHIRLYNRVSGPRQPLSLSRGWTGDAFRCLKTIAIADASTTFALAVLSSCLSRSLRAARLHLHTPDDTASVEAWIARLVQLSGPLRTFVLDGCEQPTVAFLQRVGSVFPMLESIALLPRQRNQTRRCSHQWVLPCYDVANALSQLVALKRFSCNIALATGAISPKYLDNLSAESSDDGGTVIESDGLCDAAAVAGPFAALFPAVVAVDLVSSDNFAVVRIGQERHGLRREVREVHVREHSPVGTWWAV